MCDYCIALETHLHDGLLGSVSVLQVSGNRKQVRLQMQVQGGTCIFCLSDLILGGFVVSFRRKRFDQCFTCFDSVVRDELVFSPGARCSTLMSFCENRSRTRSTADVTVYMSASPDQFSQYHLVGLMVIFSSLFQKKFSSPISPTGGLQMVPD